MAMGCREVAIGEKGFTLIEVMTALTLFSIGILGIIGMLMVGQKGIVAGRKSFLAVQTAKAQMELLRGSTAGDTGEEACLTPPTSTIQCVWSVRKGIPAKGLSTLTVTTTWYEGERKRGLVLTTLRFDGND